MKEKRIMATDDKLQWLMTKLDLGIMTRIMELWGMKAENQKQDCIKGVAEMEKQDSEMENQHNRGGRSTSHQQQEQGADEDESTGGGGGRGRGASGHVVHV